MPMPMVNQYATTYREALQNEPDAKDLNGNIAMCYLKLKLYDKALEAFEKAIVDNFDNPETFFYAAICVLGGKKAFLVQRPEIDKIEEYINAALMIEPRGIFHYFLAYIKYDYFSRKFFNTSPTYQEALGQANGAGVSPHDIEQLYGILGVSRPEAL
jgi:tetratricopeptide (TPR) repeat protein